jgi:predicted ArsR family transcriptional regulator
MIEESRESMTPARRKLLELIKSKGPQTAAELAQRLGVTPVAVRQHLQALRKDGLLVYVEERRPVGRPARRWSLSEAAQPLFPDSHREFAVGLIEAIDGAFGGEGLQRLVEERVRHQIRRYRRRMPDREAPFEERLAVLASLRNEEGYMVEWRADGQDCWVLAENHCPICAAAKVCGGLCAGEPALFQTLLGPDVEVRRTEHLLENSHRCVYQIVSRESPWSDSARVGASVPPAGTTVERGEPDEGRRQL